MFYQTMALGRDGRTNLNKKLNLTGWEELKLEMRTRKTSKPVSIVHFRTLDGELKTSRENYAKWSAQD